ncbi:MAG: RNA 2'-phosphotransferase [Tannerella sp.]|nr:RNA 2'-phosphotransferase [Tannerella sp.]
MNETDKKRIGKFLSLVLRHSPETIGIELDENGWADVDELRKKCAKHRYVFTIAQLEEIVATNNKKRYAFSEDNTKIRANQGHSIDINLELNPVEPPGYLYHGTATRFLSSIREKGILKGNRRHVHLSSDKDTAVNVGSRHGKPVVLTVMSGKMYDDGIEFYCSDNGIWLTDYVDMKYVSE